MKSYNIRNYVIYKNQVQELIWALPKFNDYKELTRDQLITNFLPLSENIARKFSTSQQASGVMTIMDLIQEGNAGLTKAVDRIDWELFDKSEVLKLTSSTVLNVVLLVEAFIRAPSLIVNPYLKSG